MTERVKIEDARAIARAAMAQHTTARRHYAPLVADAFILPPNAAENKLTTAYAPRDGQLVDKLVAVDRVGRIVKGRRKFSFAALVVVGDQKGGVGYGRGMASEVPEAVRKATEAAKRDMFFVPLRDGRTLIRDVDGQHGAGKVLLRSAKAGTGIIAANPMKAVFETLGIHDVVAKSLGSKSPYSMVRATVNALKKEQSRVADLPRTEPDPGSD